SLLGETILEWNDKDIEHYHARRMAMDSMLCRFKATAHGTRRRYTMIRLLAHMAFAITCGWMDWEP
ncbi:MAG: hypothetical protein KIG92_00735, partial [Prevotella sp.]|nr:hypothetical protein [Prevotella sp.]